MKHPFLTPFYSVLDLSNDSTVVGGFAADTLVVHPNTADTIETIEVSNQRHRGVELPFMIEQTDSIFAILLICFLFFAHMYHGGLDFLRNNFKLLFSSNSLTIRDYKGTTSKEDFFSYFLIIQSVLLISIVLYDVFMFYTPLSIDRQTPLLTIGVFVLLFVLYLLLKLALYKFEGFIFDTQQAMKVWIRSYFVIFEIIGVLFFLPTLLLVYSDFWQSYWFLLMIIALSITHLIYFYRRIYYFISEKFNFLYLIAYLCTIEIIPCVFLAMALIQVYNLDILNLLWLSK